MTDMLFADKDLTSQVEQMHPWGRVGNPDDIAKAYVFLASDDAQWMVRDLGYTYRFARHSKRMSHDDAMDTRSPMTFVGVH